MLTSSALFGTNCVSFGHQLVLSGYHLVFVWVLFGNHSDMCWVSFWYHVGISLYYFGITLISDETILDIIWASLGLRLGIKSPLCAHLLCIF